jgi:hypothetical protein
MTTVLKQSPSKGNARLVELAMSHAVDEERVQSGCLALCWLSQNSIAARCNCSRSTVERALDDLKALGRVRDTGQRMDGRYRGAVVYELVYAAGDLTQSEVTESDVTDSGSGASDLTDSAADLTHPASDLTDSAAGSDPICPPNPGVNPETNPETKPDPPAPAIAEGSGLSPSSPGSSGFTVDQAAAERREDEAELATLEEQLTTATHSDATRRCIAELRSRLGLPDLVTAEVPA